MSKTCLKCLRGTAIGLVAGALTVIGMLVGQRMGDRWGPKVEILGGVVLIAIGARILLEHLLV